MVVTRDSRSAASRLLFSKCCFWEGDSRERGPIIASPLLAVRSVSNSFDKSHETGVRLIQMSKSSQPNFPSLAADTIGNSSSIHSPLTQGRTRSAAGDTTQGMVSSVSAYAFSAGSNTAGRSGADEISAIFHAALDQLEAAHFEAVRFIPNPSPLKRFYRTFWRSITRRVLEHEH